MKANESNVAAANRIFTEITRKLRKAANELAEVGHPVRRITFSVGGPDITDRASIEYQRPKCSRCKDPCDRCKP
jgi:hypothetical protein